MSLIKQVWIVEHDTDLVGLSIESNYVHEKHMRVKVREAEFPEVPTPRYPLRHTISISLLSEDDLRKILIAICKHLRYEVQL